MKRNFPNLIEAYLEYTSKHEATPRVHKWSIISVLAAALERRVFLPRGYYTLFPNLYVFIIGRSGLIKKSTSTAIAVNLLRELQDIKLMSDRCTQASLIHQMHLSGKTYQSEDGQTHRQSPLFAYAPELSIFLEEVFGNITSLLTNFYDCSPHDDSKPWTNNTKGGGEVKIYGPCLNILGASTHAWLKKCIPATEMEGGFTSRIVFVVENNVASKLVAWPEMTQADEMMRLDLISDLRQVYGLIGAFKVTTAAKDLFTDWYHHHMRNVVPLNNDPRMSGYLARKGDAILKLAMIYSVAKNNGLVVRHEDIVYASDEFDALEVDWRGAFEGVSANYRTDDLPFELRNYIRRRGKVASFTLFKTYCQQYPEDEIKTALQTLLDMGDIKLFIENLNTFYSYPGAQLKP